MARNRIDPVLGIGVLSLHIRRDNGPAIAKVPRIGHGFVRGDIRDRECHGAALNDPVRICNACETHCIYGYLFRQNVIGGMYSVTRRHAHFINSTRGIRMGHGTFGGGKRRGSIAKIPGIGHISRRARLLRRECRNGIIWKHKHRFVNCSVQRKTLLQFINSDVDKRTRIPVVAVQIGFAGRQRPRKCRITLVRKRRVQAMRIVRSVKVRERRFRKLYAAIRIRFRFTRAGDKEIALFSCMHRRKGRVPDIQIDETAVVARSPVGMCASAEIVSIDRTVYSLCIFATDPNARNKARCVFHHR